MKTVSDAQKDKDKALKIEQNKNLKVNIGKERIMPC